jgi:hypothetical protein
MSIRHWAETAEAVLTLLENEGRDTGTGGPLSDLRDLIDEARDEAARFVASGRTTGRTRAGSQVGSQVGSFREQLERVAEHADNWASNSDAREAAAIFRQLGDECRALLAKGEGDNATSRELAQALADLLYTMPPSNIPVGDRPPRARKGSYAWAFHKARNVLSGYRATGGVVTLPSGKSEPKRAVKTDADLAQDAADHFLKLLTPSEEWKYPPVFAFEGYAVRVTRPNDAYWGLSLYDGAGKYITNIAT